MGVQSNLIVRVREKDASRLDADVEAFRAGLAIESGSGWTEEARLQGYHCEGYPNLSSVLA
eukprot:4988855-Pyramimonas_sp.AAC.1